MCLVWTYSGQSFDVPKVGGIVPNPLDKVWTREKGTFAMSTFFSLGIRLFYPVILPGDVLLV